MRKSELVLQMNTEQSKGRKNTTRPTDPALFECSSLSLKSKNEVEWYSSSENYFMCCDTEKLHWGPRM